MVSVRYIVCLAYKLMRFKCFYQCWGCSIKLHRSTCLMKALIPPLSHLREFEHINQSSHFDWLIDRVAVMQTEIEQEEEEEDWNSKKNRTSSSLEFSLNIKVSTLGRKK